MPFFKSSCFSTIERLICCLTIGDPFNHNLGVHHCALPSLGLLGKISLVDTSTSVVVPVENFMLMRPLRYTLVQSRVSAGAQDRCVERSGACVCA